MIIQLCLMMGTLLIPLIGFFIPWIDLKNSRGLSSLQRIYKSVIVYICFFLILVVMCYGHIAGRILGESATNFLVPIFYTQNISGVMTVWGFYVLFFFLFGEGILLISKTRLNKMDQMAIIVLVFSTLLYFFCQLVKPFWTPIYMSSMTQLQKISDTNEMIQSLVVKLTLIGNFFPTLIFLIVLLMTMVIYFTVFNSEIAKFHLSYNFILIYALGYILVNFLNIDNRVLVLAYMYLIVALYSIYAMKVIFFKLKQATPKRWTIFFLLILFYLVMPIFLLSILGALFSFKTKK